MDGLSKVRMIGAAEVVLVALACLAIAPAAESRGLRACGKNGGESFKPAWIGRSGYDFVWYVYVDGMSCRVARQTIKDGRSAGRDTFRASGYRCRQTESNVYGTGLVRDVYRCARRHRAFEFTAYD